ncbi:transcription initiation factor IID, 31kD subunit-domain-containing protein [Cladochytrium replicatum]|nr:transcription initiation factor IID, 31kD subunit-domain-containing protein [Cladochytrium replicatum]
MSGAGGASANGSTQENSTVPRDWSPNSSNSCTDIFWTFCKMHSFFAEHANRQDVDLDDVKLAIDGRVGMSFTNPQKEVLLELAQRKNNVPLPIISEKLGARLRPERHCLTADKLPNIT